MKDFIRMLAALTVLLVLGACSSAERRLLSSGTDSRIDRVKIEAHASDQASITAAISRAAGIPAEAGTPQQYTSEQWRVFVLAGINYVDLQCNDYLGALNRFYRAKNTTKQQIALLGSATLGIMGAVSVAAQALAITGIAFGLATASVDNLASGLIYELPAADVIQLVRTMQQTYKGALPPGGYNNQPAAYAAIQGYINICLQTSIETQVANAVKQAKVEAKKGDAEANTAPIVQVGPITSFSYSSDDDTKLLEKFLLKADGSLDQAKLQEAVKALKAEGIDRTVFELLVGYPADRQKLVKKLGLK